MARTAGGWIEAALAAALLGLAAVGIWSLFGGETGPAGVEAGR